METNQLTETAGVVISQDQLLEHWQGHRRLTRKVIETFPEDKIFSYSIRGMRPFSELIMEMIDLAGGGISGLVSNLWKSMNDFGHVSGNLPKTKEEILKQWDNVTTQINALWPQISRERFQEVIMALVNMKGQLILQFYI
ncbi:damage-inducible protein DinB [Pedobacter sp. P351]|uniref:DinB family protein n=1 Tax=Pedobacter superstes TaxID=3133441 RepID=UPI0030A644C5